MLKLGFCITGSFCSMDDMLIVMKELVKDYEIEVFLTPHVNTMDTRFYSSHDLKEKIKEVSKKRTAYDNTRSRSLWTIKKIRCCSGLSM
ncbi:hypothetical protein HMPREF9488_02541 [Coprobacillus cateniformis]|uniref:Uncharacterized protein n=1 Tax=Coprobacillus cateniformis TaxID=100884 RepID=E7GCP9_9FIRM|nr:hypothetical protein [Coprobacillus cateniformis]EFW04258.1 hypothetical protein HMPREF9488_02541 [Coprobacillus cateniformis]